MSEEEFQDDGSPQYQEEEDNISEQSEQAEPQPQPRKKGKNVKGDLENKRKRALENLAKGRAKRMANLKKRKEMFQVQEDDSDSDSEEELIISRKGKGKREPAEPAYQSQPSNVDLAAILARQNAMIEHLEKRTRRKRPSVNVNVTQPPAQQSVSSEAKQVKDKMMMYW